MALNDINQMFSIVDPNTGKPTDYLMRLLRDRGVEVTDIESVVATIDGTEIIGGDGIDGSGILGTDTVITLDLSDTGVTPGSYTGVDLTVDAKGRITAVASGSGGGGSVAVDDEGVEIIPSVSRLNFTGSGVTVVDLGSGEVEISIPGGGGGGGVPTVVQTKAVAVASLATGITLTAPPAAGSVLVAVAFSNSGALSLPPGVGWTQMGTGFSASTNHVTYRRVAGVGESATQNPTTATVSGLILMYEISGAQVATQASGSATATSTVINYNIAYTGVGEYLRNSSGLAIVIGMRRENAAATPTGSFSTVQESILESGGITGIPMMIAAASTPLVINSNLTGSWTWATSLASATCFIVVS